MLKSHSFFSQILFFQSLSKNNPTYSFILFFSFKKFLHIFWTKFSHFFPDHEIFLPSKIKNFFTYLFIYLCTQKTPRLLLLLLLRRSSCLRLYCCSSNEEWNFAATDPHLVGEYLSATKRKSARRAARAPTRIARQGSRADTHVLLNHLQTRVKYFNHRNWNI